MFAAFWPVAVIPVEPPNDNFFCHTQVYTYKNNQVNSGRLKNSGRMIEIALAAWPGAGFVFPFSRSRAPREGRSQGKSVKAGRRPPRKRLGLALLTWQGMGESAARRKGNAAFLHLSLGGHQPEALKMPYFCVLREKR